MNLAVAVSKVILPPASDREEAETVRVSVPPVYVTVRVVPPAPYFVDIAVCNELILIAGLTVKVTTVVVSTNVVDVSANVTIARYRYLFILVVSAAVVKVSVVKPVPLATSDQATEETAVIVSVATCHLTVFENGEATKVVPTVKESVNPAVVVSFVG
jgi:hypothetical protein